MTFGSLFAGIGGMDLGLERAGMSCKWQVEINPFCNRVLEKHWPTVRRHDDVKTFPPEDGTDWGADLLCGGFPCQPFSTASAGKRVAVDLWPEMLRVVSELLPTYVLAENVLAKPIEKAKSDLEDIGYVVTARNISANDAGADHNRNRWWLCAYADDESKLHCPLDAEVAELQELCEGVWCAENYAAAIRVSDGISNRVDRLKGLGNSVVPQVAEWIGKQIMEAKQ